MPAKKKHKKTSVASPGPQPGAAKPSARKGAAKPSPSRKGAAKASPPKTPKKAAPRKAASKRAASKKAAAAARPRRALRIKPIVGPFQFGLPLQMPLALGALGCVERPAPVVEEEPAPESAAPARQGDQASLFD